MIGEDASDRKDLFGDRFIGQAKLFGFWSNRTDMRYQVIRVLVPLWRLHTPFHDPPRSWMRAAGLPGGLVPGVMRVWVGQGDVGIRPELDRN